MLYYIILHHVTLDSIVLRLTSAITWLYDAVQALQRQGNAIAGQLGKLEVV